MIAFFRLFGFFRHLNVCFFDDFYDSRFILLVWLGLLFSIVVQSSLHRMLSLFLQFVDELVYVRFAALTHLDLCRFVVLQERLLLAQVGQGHFLISVFA